AFDTAKKVLQRIVAEGAQRPGAQKITVLLASRPTESLSGLTERDIDEGLLTEIADRLPLMECTHQAFDPAKSLQAALERLADDRTSLRYVHVLSDFRKRDWLDNEAAITALEELSTGKVGINLVRCVGEQHENLSLVDLQGEVAVAAAGVPVTFRAEVANNGTREVKDVRAQILIDGNRLPRTLDFGDIAANETAERRFDVVFDIAKLHRLQVRLHEDALVTDDTRYMAVDVPVENPVLIVDGSPSGEQALYLADALAADKSVTGFAPEIRPATDLRRIPLDRFHIVYLVNVPELPPDAIDAVKKYVENGGGLVWYLGPNVNAVSYNQTLFADSGLFPTKLALAPTALEHSEETEKSPDIVVGTHPMFEVFAGAENPLIDLVSVNLAFEPDADMAIEDPLLPETEVLATLRDKRPLVLLHRVGKGQVLTCLTSAGPVKTEETTWTNWANGPGKISFVVFQLEL
ncbi:MAG: hypothetical protein KDA66_20125, partial [Planctomycetaceae bacterium]|nr:hypothetical protein [Planctomycetaceae bacterium]